MIKEKWNGYNIVLTNHCIERLKQRDVKLDKAIEEIKKTSLTKVKNWVYDRQVVGFEIRGKERFGFFVDFRDNSIVLVSIVNLKAKSKLFVKDHVIKEVR